MPKTHLTEAGWKTELGKAKNLGLRAQGTGVSEKLRAYEAANAKFAKNRTTAAANDVLKALQELKTVADQQSKSHKQFTEATNYLKEVVKATNARGGEVTEEKEAIETLATVRDALKDAYKNLAAIKTAAQFQKKGAGNLNGDVRVLMKAGKFKEVNGNTMAKLNNRCLVDSSLADVTDQNLAAKKKEVQGFLDDLKGELAKVKI
jgi:hypothetical protein